MVMVVVIVIVYRVYRQGRVNHNGDPRHVPARELRRHRIDGVPHPGAYLRVAILVHGEVVGARREEGFRGVDGAVEEYVVDRYRQEGVE